MKLVLLLLAAIAPLSLAQSATPKPVDVHTAADLQATAAKLKEEGMKKPDGMAGVTLEKYPDHLTMLTYRSQNGGAELHQHYADIFVILDGDATILTGGTIANEKTSGEGEVRGSAVVGGTPQKLAKGDIVHISPNVPHQMLIEKGHSLVYFVVKVKQ